MTAQPPAPGSHRVAVVHNLDFVEADDDIPSTDDFDARANADVAEVATHVTQALRSAGHTPLRFGVQDSIEALIPELRAREIDVVFNLVESLGGDPRREPEVPRALAKAGFACTGNPARALTNALHKDVVRQVLGTHRIPIARGCAVVDPAKLGAVKRARLRYPLFVKPAAADGSIGISQESVVINDTQLRERVEFLLGKIPGPYLVEEYLPGPEINVAIFPAGPGPGHARLVPTTIDFSGNPRDCLPIVTYACKWDEASPEYQARTVPLGDLISPAARRDLLRTAEAAFYVLGGTSYGRVDLRLDASGRACVIDVNPNPDLHPEAGYCIALRDVQVPYVQLVDTIVQQAVRRARPVASSLVRPRSGTARCAFAVG
ncbi:D-alanine--D-alanine ligase [Enhygromyxa salina]|uniref:D-alanine--D-alanine ligase n=1 Tax=Enhygromyxa salina TaxID=215803 RepID=A0A0C2DD64_9BACT|nr:hypothetical protein [Enhygromyxa salina]KIG19370.1 D-alanine--D-alanine ligase [Enhygromyxa salina]